MTTSRSPLHILQAQADKISALLKAIERGEKVDVGFASKVEASRGQESIKFGVVMDDKIVTIEMPWAVLRETSEPGLAEYILKQMRGVRDALN